SQGRSLVPRLRPFLFPNYFAIGSWQSDRRVRSVLFATITQNRDGGSACSSAGAGPPTRAVFACWGVGVSPAVAWASCPRFFASSIQLYHQRNPAWPLHPDPIHF